MPIRIFLRVIGVAALLAFAAAVMPSQWMIAIARQLGIEPFPDSPLTFYLARNLSLLYGYVGVLLMLIASDLPRYRPLVWWVAVGTISFGAMQFIVDSMAGMPGWWTFGESGSTFFGGVLLWWLDARTSKDAAT
ncbi:hypothetical protein [Rhodopirellula sp. SWK7]|uniref:hypothetical protein n=1 Tax=Rhodopirellula sp. SWK7 TaxID=595460 RepID=UPI0002BFB398|nr:hypothetical protein [Rhodopirellula sp. SWK7]EMI43272.1 signal peptide protein [Rhodopirellula sp. SWK7]